MRYRSFFHNPEQNPVFQTVFALILAPTADFNCPLNLNRRVSGDKWPPLETQKGRSIIHVEMKEKEEIRFYSATPTINADGFII